MSVASQVVAMCAEDEYERRLQEKDAECASLRTRLAEAESRVSYLEGVLSADECYTRCRDCGAYVHESDNDWAVTDDGDELCDACNEKMLDEGNGAP